MNKSIRWVMGASLLLLSTCVFSQDFKIRFEPMLPVPFLIVPDNNHNNQNYVYQGNNHDRRHDNDGYRQDYYEGKHHRRHDNDGYRQHHYEGGNHHRRHNHDGYRRDYYQGENHHRRHDNDEYRQSRDDD